MKTQTIKTQGKFIVIEGMDGSGKTTLTDDLTEHLKNKGYKVWYDKFPRYATPLGQLILKGLNDSETFDPTSLQMLFATDKVHWTRDAYPKLIEEYDYIIVDRYTLSAYVYYQLDGGNLDFVKHLHSEVIKPDMYIVLIGEPEILYNRITSRLEESSSDENQISQYETIEKMTKSKELYQQEYEDIKNIIYVDANGTPEDTFNKCKHIISSRFE